MEVLTSLLIISFVLDALSKVVMFSIGHSLKFCCTKLSSKLQKKD